jgi:hypothetical protein
MILQATQKSRFLATTHTHQLKRTPAKMAVRFHRHLVQHGASLPFGLGDKVVERLVITARHDFLYALYVFATGLHQALEVLLDLGGNRTRPALKVRREALCNFSDLRPFRLGVGYWGYLPKAPPWRMPEL